MKIDSRHAMQLSQVNILVVDDNAQMCSIIGAVLRAAGVRNIHFAPNGVAALETIAKRQIDVVYVDYEMPIMNGLQFISAVRSADSTQPYLPIIMLTGHSDLARLNEARDTGVTEFLCKPVTAKDILKRLEAVITHPRPFINSGTYFGPDRRRQQARDYSGPRRRASDRPEDPVSDQR